MSNNIKVRFAPSPTGHLHIGGVRTALFNYLYARNQGGQFVLRIEDTDQERSAEEFTHEILNSLKWIGMEWDGDISRQTEHLPRYQELAQQLVAEGVAYKVDDTPAIKFKMPHKQVVFWDVVKGKIEFDASLFDDLVILKSDGFPTYHFACVVDDHDMEVSHVIRGEDHVSNTPRHILLYEAFGWKIPKYAHLPLIVGDDGAPLSKRHGNVSLVSYQEEGYLPEALLNYLALLGWGPGGNEELFSKEALIKKFSLKRVNSANAGFNQKKLNYINSEHLKKMKPEDCAEEGLSFLKNRKLFPERCSEEDVRKVFMLFQTRIKTWKDVLIQADYCFCDSLVYDKSSVEKYLKVDGVSRILTSVLSACEALSDFTEKGLEECVRKTAETLGVNAATLIHPIRVAITGWGVSPGLFEVMELLGKEKVLKRIGFVIENLGELPFKE